MPCGVLHWPDLQAPGGASAAIYITLRRYLPTPHPGDPAGSDRAKVTTKIVPYILYAVLYM